MDLTFENLIKSCAYPVSADLKQNLSANVSVPVNQVQKPDVFEKREAPKEVKQAIKEEIKQEIKEELKKELREEIKEHYHPEIHEKQVITEEKPKEKTAESKAAEEQSEIKKEVQQEVKQPIKQETTAKQKPPPQPQEDDDDDTSVNSSNDIKTYVVAGLYSLFLAGMAIFSLKGILRSRRRFAEEAERSAKNFRDFDEEFSQRRKSTKSDFGNNFNNDFHSDTHSRANNHPGGNNNPGANWWSDFFRNTGKSSSGTHNSSGAAGVGSSSSNTSNSSRSTGGSRSTGHSSKGSRAKWSDIPFKPPPRAAAINIFNKYGAGLSSNPTQDEIRKAFRGLSLKYHPDRKPADKNAYAQITKAFNDLK
jgi:hypothetical protein